MLEILIDVGMFKRNDNLGRNVKAKDLRSSQNLSFIKDERNKLLMRYKFL